MSDFLYHNFDLLVEPAGAGYRARVVASPAGEGAVAFVAPFSAAELAGFPLVTPEPAAACDLGGRLHAAVLAGPVRDLWQRSLQAAHGAGSGLRLRLRLAAAPETAAWPWEYLFEAATREFTALSARTPVVRYLDLPAAAAAVAAAPPLGMLVALAQPARYVPWDLAGTWQGLQAALAPLGEQIAVARLQPPTLSALQRHLRRQTCHILHFVGHGGVNATGDGVTIWEDEAGQGCVVPAPILATLLRDARETPRLVMLNTCAGASSSTDDPFSGTAQALVQAGIPAVVAFQAAVTIQTALTCATELYGALADGLPVDAAITEARKAVYARAGSMAWGNLLLFMRSPDGRLFQPSSAGDQVAASDPALAEEDGKNRSWVHSEGATIGRDLDNRGGIFVGRDYKTGA